MIGVDLSINKEIVIREDFQKYLRKLNESEYKELEASIIKDGCTDPVVLWGNILVDGHHRYKICNEHNITFFYRQKEFEDETAVKLWMIRNQRARRNLSTLELAELALLEKELYAEEAEQRMLAGTPIKSDPGTLGYHQPEAAGRTRERLSDLYGIGEQTLARVDKIKQVAPERLEDIRKGDTSIKAVYTELMRQQRREDRKQEYKDNPLPEGIFDVILADPPWEYEFCPTLTREIENHYPTMELKDIKAIEIPAADDAVLFLWTTGGGTTNLFFKLAFSKNRSLECKLICNCSISLQ